MENPRPIAALTSILELLRNMLRPAKEVSLEWRRGPLPGSVTVLITYAPKQGGRDMKKVIEDHVNRYIPELRGSTGGDGDTPD